MFKDVIGLIMADDVEVDLGEISRPRALGAMPFGGRYRIIDFVLSNFVNTHIYNVGVSTFVKYRSLMDHLGTGSPWDLDRMNEGLHILPPSIGIETSGGKGDDIGGIWDFYRDFPEKYIIIASCQCIYNTTYTDFIKTHIESGADITVMYNVEEREQHTPYVVLDLDKEQKVRGVFKNPTKRISDAISMNTIIMRRETYIDLLANMMSTGEKDATVLTFINFFKEMDVRGYCYTGEVLRINSLQSYFIETMRALSEPTRSCLFYAPNPIYTKVKDEAPTFYNDTCDVDNSMISDGCSIRGTVKDSMLFRGVTVGRQSTVLNSIIFQDTFISEGCHLENVIIDKDSIIRPGTRLIGNPNYPVVIGKGVIV